MPHPRTSEKVAELVCAFEEAVLALRVVKNHVELTDYPDILVNRTLAECEALLEEIREPWGALSPQGRGE